MKWITPRRVGITIAALLALVVTMSAVYTIPEGHVGIVKRFQKAIAQVDPGINIKAPFIDSVERIEVRQRKNTEELPAATANQLPVRALVSINWTVDKTAAMELFVKYGGLDQFEHRILDPKLRSASKGAISKFPADELIRNRQAAVSAIMSSMSEELAGFPVTVNSPQLENIVLPEDYLDAVKAKEKAREEAEREKHKLEQQRLVAQQAVNTAKAEAEAKRLAADAEAYRFVTEGKARAEAIAAVTSQLAGNELYVSYIVAQTWDGKLPTTMLGEGTNALLKLP